MKKGDKVRLLALFAEHKPYYSEVAVVRNISKSGELPVDLKVDRISDSSMIAADESHFMFTEVRNV